MQVLFDEEEKSGLTRTYLVNKGFKNSGSRDLYVKDGVYVEFRDGQWKNSNCDCSSKRIVTIGDLKLYYFTITGRDL